MSHHISAPLQPANQPNRTPRDRSVAQLNRTVSPYWFSVDFLDAVYDFVREREKKKRIKLMQFLAINMEILNKFFMTHDDSPHWRTVVVERKRRQLLSVFWHAGGGGGVFEGGSRVEVGLSLSLS